MSQNGRQWTRLGQNSPEFVKATAKRRAAKKTAKASKKKNR